MDTGNLLLYQDKHASHARVPDSIYSETSSSGEDLLEHLRKIREFIKSDNVPPSIQESLDKITSFYSETPTEEETEEEEENDYVYKVVGERGFSLNPYLLENITNDAEQKNEGSLKIEESETTQLVEPNNNLWHSDNWVPVSNAYVQPLNPFADKNPFRNMDVQVPEVKIVYQAAPVRYEVKKDEQVTLDTSDTVEKMRLVVEKMKNMNVEETKKNEEPEGLPVQIIKKDVLVVVRK